MNTLPTNALFSKSRLASCILIALLASGTVYAAPAAGAAAASEETKAGEAEGKKENAQLGEVTVTGSALASSPDEVAVPVVTIDSAQIAQLGVTTNALEILRKAVPAFAGRSNAGNSNANNNNQNTAGGSQLQLRNLPTLILVNGRRVSNSGVGGINGKNFVDVSQIPASAIDRIEILADGASALYGSDAIGGVVNFILKTDFNGLSVIARMGDADGNYGERSISATAGTTIGGTSLVATVSSQHSDPLYQNTRSFTSPLYNKSSAIPGVVNGGSDILNGGLASPSQRNPTGTAATANSIADLVKNGTYLPTTSGAISGGFDVSQYQTLLLRQNQDAIVASLSNHLIEDKLELFGDMMLSHNQSYTRWLPVASTGNTVPVATPYNPLTTAFPGVTFAYLPYTHDFANDVTGERFTAGLRGEISSDWSWETGVVYSKSDLEQQQKNLIYKPNISRAIAGGYDANGNAVAGGAYSKVYSGYSLSGPLVLAPALDPFALAAGVNPGALTNLYGTEVIDASSKLTSFDLQFTGKLFSLPAGEIAIALGGSARRESLSGHTDANGRVTDPATGSTTGNDQQWLGGTYADPFSKSRDVYGVFTEIRIPITSEAWNVAGLRAFDLTLSGREEKYSDVGSSFVPKVGFLWQPFDKQFGIRGNYSESFAAPSLYSLFGPTDTRQVGAGVIQGIFGNNYTGMPFNGEDGNNPNLAPAKSTSRTIGFTLRPEFAKGLSVAADYSDIKLKGFGGGIGFNNILGSINTLGSASPFFSNLGVDAFPGTTGGTQPFVHPGDLLAFLTNPATGKGDPNQAERLYVVDQFRNLASLQEKSWVISADYVIPTDQAGTFKIATSGAIFNEFKFQSLPGTAFIEYAGHANNTGVFGGTLPKYHFYSSLDWTQGDLELTLGNTWISSTTDTGANGTSTPLIHVDSYVTWDFRLGYDFHGPDSGSLKVVKFGVGVNNIGNRMPSPAPRAFLDNNADVSTFSPIGRLIYVTVGVDF